MARPSPEPRFESAEVEILVRCARASIGPVSLAGIDWNALILAAETHGMLPLLHRRLGTAPDVPRLVQVELLGRYEATARGNRVMTRELARILAALGSAGIAAIPYKGPALAFSLYGDIALREYCDLDIVIRPRDIPRAKEALAALGYAPEYPLEAGVERAFLRASSQYHLGMHGPRGTVVELHWKTDADFPVERDDDAWWSNLAHAPIEELTVRAFSARELMLVLCLHGSKHGWERLAWLADVAQMIRQHPDMDWQWIFERADAMGCMRRLALGLHLAHALLDAPLPEAVRRRVEAQPRVAGIAREIRERLFTEGNIFREGPRALRFNLGLYERSRHRLAHVYNTLFAPSLVEWTRWPLPRALHFLYPAMRLSRLALKYLRRAPAQRPPAKPA
jgi:hypothetical protein